MGYQKLSPAEILKPYVESIWIQEVLSVGPNWQPTKIIPSTKVDLIFYYLDPFVQHDNGGKEIIPRNVLHGQMTKPLTVSATGKTGLIIFSFYPWGITPFINIPFHELTDKSIDAGLIFGARAINKIHSKILESKTNYERVDHIQKFLISRLPEKPVDPFAVHLARLINEQCGSIKINRIAQNSNISRRHLQRRFSSITGLSPKQFAGIIRFQKALFLKRGGFHWADIAEKCGYYDQPHFIKEIKHYSGTSPDKIYTHVKPTKLMHYFNSPNSMSHFYNTIYL